MNDRIKLFLKYAEHQHVIIGSVIETQNNSLYRYCVGTDCSDCILNFEVGGAGDHYLGTNDIIAVREMFPEYFL